MLRTKFVNKKNNQKGWTQYFKIIYLQRDQEKLKKLKGQPQYMTCLENGKHSFFELEILYCAPTRS